MNRFGYSQDTDDACVTVVSNAFINHFMVKARGDYVKVYLYGLKYCSNPKPPVPSNQQIASDLSMTESDVINAWKYWKEKGIINFESDGDDMYISYVNIVSYLFTGGAQRQKENDSKIKLTEQPLRIRAMFSDIESLMGAPLNTTYCDSINLWLDTYHFSPETAILIVSDCLKRGKAEIKYWDKVAEDFSARGITRYDEAAAYISQRDSENADIREVLNYLGLYRNPTQPERRVFLKWKNEFMFDKEMVIKACDQVARPTIRNVDAILTAWHNGEEPEQSHTRYVSRSNQRQKMDNDHDYDLDELEDLIFGDL